MSGNEIDFIGIGGYRCATTWISRCLQEHPDILFSAQKSQKELHFFNDQIISGLYYKKNPRYAKGLKWYLKQFPKAKPGKLRGEYSVSYLPDKKAPQRIKEAFSNVKLIVSLRNPVDVLYSGFKYSRGGILSEVDEFPSIFEKVLESNDYLDLGFYSNHLKRYFDLFPREDVFIIIYEEDILEKPAETIQNLYRFLGVVDDVIPPTLEQRINKSFQVKMPYLKKLGEIVYTYLGDWRIPVLNKTIFQTRFFRDLYSLINKKDSAIEAMRPEVRSKLEKFYHKDISRLENLIGRDLSCWRSD
ncbi:hypothetical protein GF360_02345 [candidate division WWE3 bacterium]|nr:hypothetical protein [candidate division WWE3 bacterium]